MNYYVLLLIQAPEREQFIEVGLDYELPFHPNLTDEIEIAGFPCKINEIYYNLDDLDHVTIRAEATDCLISMRNNPSSKDIHKWLMHTWDELKKWTESNNERIILNDCLNDPDKELDDF